MSACRLGRSTPRRHGSIRHRETDPVATLAGRAGIRRRHRSPLASEFNHQLAEAYCPASRPLRCSRPSRLKRAAAAQELELSRHNFLGLKGAIVNSHTWAASTSTIRGLGDLFEAAEALDVPIYLHPNTSSPRMIEPFLERGLDGAIFGFAVETGLPRPSPDRQRCVRQIPQAAHRAGPSGKLCLLAFAHRFHACADGLDQPLLQRGKVEPEA